MEERLSKPNAPAVGTLIVTWNRRRDLLECVESVLRSTYPSLTVYVVDNASTDSSSCAIRQEFPGVRIIRSPENLGFSGGNNLGLALMISDGIEAAFLINDDLIVEEDTIEKLVSNGFHDPKVGILAPKVLLHSQPGVIWSAGGTVDPVSGVAAQRHCGETDAGQAEVPIEVDYAIGCAMLVKTEAIRRTGLIDPRYFMYYEEADWCRRMAQAGYKVLYVPQSRVRHKVTLSNNGRNHAPYYFSRNRLLYLETGGAGPARIAWVAFSDILRSAAVHAIKGRADRSRLMLKGVADYYLRNFGRMGSGA